MNNTKILNTIPSGETFKIGDMEFIKFSDENGITTAVSKDAVLTLVLEMITISQIALFLKDLIMRFSLQ